MYIYIYITIYGNFDSKNDGNQFIEFVGVVPTLFLDQPIEKPYCVGCCSIENRSKLKTPKLISNVTLALATSPFSD